MAEKIKGGYYSVIPADVLFCPELSSSAKLMYALLTNLCDRAGYCWASNEYLAEIFGVAPVSVSRWVSQLERLGFIRSEMASRDTGAERRIYAGAFVVKPESGLIKNDETPRGDLIKNDKGGLIKNDNTPQGRILNNNIQTVNNTPHNPPNGGDACAKTKNARFEHKDTAEWKPERFEKFWKYYHSIAPKVKSGRQATIRAWDKLQPDDGLISRMAAALEVLRNTDDWRRGIGIPHASTWLNNSRWEDVETAAEDLPERYPDESGVYTAEDSPYQRWSREWEREHGEK